MPTFQVPTERLLLADQWAPVTSYLGFVEASPDHAAQVFENRLRDVYESRSITVSASPLQAPSLGALLAGVLPLTSVLARRFLFVPTRSNWTAYFDSRSRGADVQSVMMELASSLRTRGLRVSAVPDTIRKEGALWKGREGVLRLTLYDRETGGRALSLSKDGGPWKFSQSGSPLPFEDQSRYRAKRVADRFTFDLLCGYLAELGLFPFDESFYRVDGGASYRLQLEGAIPPAMRELTLDQSRADF